MKQVLPDYVKEARDRSKYIEGVPVVSKKTYKLVKSWKRKGVPPSVANHPFWMNPRLTCQSCGTIVLDKIRLERDARARLRREKAEGRALERKMRKGTLVKRYWFEG